MALGFGACVVTAGVAGFTGSRIADGGTPVSQHPMRFVLPAAAVY